MTVLADLMVVFDWNGTVVADVDRAVQATNEVLAGHRLPALSRVEFRAGFSLPLGEWLGRLGVPDPATAEDGWNAAMARRRAPTRAGAVAAIAELAGRGAHVGVVSAAGSDAVGADLAATGLAAHLHDVATGVRDKAEHLRARRGLRPRAVYVGDTEYDIVSARAAGFVPVAVSGGYRPRAALRRAEPFAIVDDLAELVALLAG